MALVPPARPSKLYANLALALLVVGAFFLNGYQHTIFSRPISYHKWRQADCLSITKNYYEEGMRFFNPVIHYQGPEGGRAVGECPLLNYTVAALWHVFGEHEFIYRLLVYAIFLIAVFVLFNTLLRHAGSPWLAFFVSSLLVTSPLLVYYSFGFMSDVPALSLAIVCFCLLYRFAREGRKRSFYWALVTGTLAVLMKASALVPLTLVILTWLGAFAGRYNMTKQPFVHRKTAGLSIALALAAIVGWYGFAVYYNEFDKNNIFLLTFLPIWELEQTEMLHKLRILFDVQFPLFLNRPMFFLVFLCAAFVVSRFRKLDVLLRWSFVVAAAFFVVYILLFFWVFDVHDYYLVNVMIFPVITFFCTAQLLTGSGLPHNRLFLRIFITGAVLLNGFHAATVYRLRMMPENRFLRWSPFISDDEIGLAEYLEWDEKRDSRRLHHFTPVLRRAGITREQRVLTIPDHSFNVTLYLMDQKGYTIARDDITSDSTVMGQFMGIAEYIVLSDTTLMNERAWKRTARRFEHFFTEGPVKVFKIKRRR